MAQRLTNPNDQLGALLVTMGQTAEVGGKTIRPYGRGPVTDWRKHTGTEMPSNLAPAQIIENYVQGGPIMEDVAESIDWSCMGEDALAFYYRPALDPDDLWYKF